IGKSSWLRELENISLSHGVSLLRWRSGGLEHPHDTPPYPFTPSPTFAHSSNGERARLYTHPGNDLTHRFSLIIDTLARLRSRSSIIAAESVACDDNGVASFELVRHQPANDRIFLYAFALIELNGDALRRDPLEVRKATLASIVAKASPGIYFNEHI